jgi:hypothetical protein
MWLGGDVLVPRWLLAELARDPDSSLELKTIESEPAIEGAALSDLREAIRQALPREAPA